MKANVSGWFKQSLRHSNARRFGRAGGIYSKKFGYTTLPAGKRTKPLTLRASDDTIKDMYYYRLIWKNTTNKQQNGLFEKFMVLAFDERKEPYYAKEWAERFASGNPTTWMDSHRKEIYMTLLKNDDVYDEDIFPKSGYKKGERENIEKQAYQPFKMRGDKAKKTTEDLEVEDEAVMPRRRRTELGLPLHEDDRKFEKLQRGFNTKAELEAFIKKQGNKNLDFEWEKNGITYVYEPQRDPKSGLWHNRIGSSELPDI